MDKNAKNDRGTGRGRWPIVVFGLWVVTLLGGMGLGADNAWVVISMPTKRILRCWVLHRRGYDLQWPLIKINAVDCVGLPGSRQTRIRIGWFHLGARQVSRSLSGIRLLVPGSRIRVIRLWGQWWWLSEARAWMVILGAATCLGSIALSVLLGASLKDACGCRMLEIGETQAGALGLTRLSFHGGSVGHAAIIILSLGVAAAAAPILFAVLFNRCIPALLPTSLLAAATGTSLMLWAMICFGRPDRAHESDQYLPKAQG